MHKQVLFVLTVLFLAIPAQSSENNVGGFVELRRGLVNNPIEGGQYHFSIAGPLLDKEGLGVGKWGWSAWALVNRDYSLAYVGPTYDATSWLQLRISGGVQSGKRGLLVGSSAIFHGALGDWPNEQPWAIVLVYERVAQDFWWQAVGDIGLTEHLGVGVHSEKSLGVGPLLEWHYGPWNLKSTLWAAAPFTKKDDDLKLTLLAGVRLNF